MHQSVIDNWRKFSDDLEGHVHSMYLDIKGLVTTGVGLLIDPIDYALRLPWKLPDGTTASDAQVREQWHRLKARQDLKTKHWKYAAEITTIRLTDADIDALVLGKLLENHEFMRNRYFTDIDEWPADAQLGVHSMAWALGAGFPATFKNFAAAVKRGDWRGARASCEIRWRDNPGVRPRNQRNEVCFENAAIVIECGMERSRLHWPGVAVPPEPGLPETIPPPAEPGLVPLDPDFDAIREERDAAIKEPT